MILPMQPSRYNLEQTLTWRYIFFRAVNIIEMKFMAHGESYL